MNFISLTVLLLTSSSQPVSGDEGNVPVRNTEGSASSPSRSMLRKADAAADVVVVEKEAYRNDSIPLIEGSDPVDQDERLLAKECSGDSKQFIMEIVTDKYGFEDSWQLRKRTGSKWVTMEFGPPQGRNYADNTRYVGRYCLEPGNYRYIIKDKFKDGMCCTFGKGKYVGYLDGSKEFSSPSGDQGWAKRTHDFSIGGSSSVPLPLNPKISMSTRDAEWLDSHNTRRKQWHERYRKTYVPLQWSNALKDESKKFAEKLLEDSCGGLYHDPGNIHGENLASNSGTGSWAQVRPTDSIVTRWVENEADDPYPANGHLTQVLWRGSKYVGCADASKPKNGGGMCHTQVCRYARPGNCNMNKYRDGSAEWWLTPMLMDDSPCSPRCPPDGCR